MIDWLTGVTVVELTANVAGPYSALVLSDLGARVLKVESPGAGDVVRKWPPFYEQGSTSFAGLNRGKASVAIDLKSDQGADIARRLISNSDVFLESLRPGAVTRLGLGWPTMSELNPRLVYCSLSAYGDVGPLAGEPGFDAIIQAYTGLMDLTGHPDGEPARVGTGIVDFGAGLWAALSVIGGLLQRERTGQGCRVESTMLGSAIGFLMHHLAAVEHAQASPTRIGTAQHNTAPYEAVRTQDGTIMVGVSNDALWLRFVAAIDRDDVLAKDERFTTNASRVENRKALVAVIESLLADVTAEQACARLAQHGIPSSQIRKVSALAGDAQADALGLWQTDPTGHRFPVMPVRVNGHTPGLRSSVPELGGATAEILAELAITADEIADLAARGVIGTASAAGSS